MSSFTQPKSERVSWAYIYIFIGGLSSLLILFLISKSLPYNQIKAQKYYQQLKTAQQKVTDLERQVWLSLFSNAKSKAILKTELENTKKAFSELKQIPNFISVQQQSIINSKLETQEVLFNTQLDLFQDFQNIKQDSAKSCQSTTQLKQEVNSLKSKNNISSDNLNFLNIAGELLVNLALQCYRTDNSLDIQITSQIKQLELLLQEKKDIELFFIATEVIDRGQKIVSAQNKLAELNSQLQLATINQNLVEIELDYLTYLDQAQNKIALYRLATYLLSLAIIIFIAYKIINNLAKTNRNIVKVLEGFTQELETKVEQRTAQLEESIQNTEAALAQAQNANKAKSRFLANMSHELRTPLNAILGFTQLMCRDSSIAQEHQENIQIINRSGEHLLKLINDILEMSKIEVGQITLNENKFDFYTMLKSIEEMLRMKAEAKKLNLTFAIAKNVPQYIFTDEGKLRQILINLLGNALKFTEKGGITLTVELTDRDLINSDHIDFLFSDTYALNFAIKDTGPGIATEEMDRLFSPFEQTQTGRVSSEGTGLGLSICQKFVELMGGELKVDSEVGKGSTFSFTILVKSENSKLVTTADARELKPTKTIIGLASNQPEYRILAVDDVPASRLLLKKMLTGIGFAVEEAADGREAIQKWSNWHPDLILMDMRMPVMDGYEATKQIKSQPEGQATIIIALTASAFEEERVVILSAGCDDFMRKPFYEAELLEVIGKYLGVDYIYEEKENVASQELIMAADLSTESLAVMSLSWRSQLYEAAARVDNQEILQLLAEIPEEYESLAKGLESLVEQFRCDKIIDLTKSVN